MKCIDQVPVEELRGKRVIVRAGFDLSLDERGEVNDFFRVERALATLTFLKNAGAKTIILSHIGRDPSLTNAPVARTLKRYMPAVYLPELVGPRAQAAVASMKDGETLLLENIRQQYEEEKSNDPGFAKALASLGELYVNDAFSNSHREHASMVGIPALLPAYAGFIVRDEVEHLSRALRPQHPSLVIIGGSKFETKGAVVRSFLESYEHVILVGAIANDILKMRGISVGRSKTSDRAPQKSVALNPKLIVLPDVTVESVDGRARVKKVTEIGPDDMTVDIGPDTVALMAPLIEKAKTILWNGTTGVYEHGYNHFTKQIADMIAARVEEGVTSVIGGGDTIAALDAADAHKERLGFLSTGGGAMLDFLLEGTLPALRMLN